MEKAIKSKNFKSATEESIKKKFLLNQKKLKDLHYNKSKKNKATSGILWAKRRTGIVDDLIRDVVNASGLKELKGISIVALGGYGRGELCPYSDIDLLFLYEPRGKSVAQQATRNLLYFLWDLKLDVGHSIRTVQECIELSKEENEDTTILTSLLDARLILGDQNVFDKLNNKLFNELLPSISESFIDRKIQEYENRVKRFGRSIYILEPNVKEGVGGLRDINNALWIAQAKYKVKTFSELLEKGVLFPNELSNFEKCLNFLLLIRSELHYLAEMGEDRLSFQYQEQIAKFFGFKDAELPAVERFMRIYYLRCNIVKEQCRRLVQRTTRKYKFKSKPSKVSKVDDIFIIRDGMLSISNRNSFLEHPGNLMKAFEYSDKYNIKMNDYLNDLVHWNVNVATIDDTVRRNREVNASFIRILQRGHNVADTLYEMKRLRLLGNYIPEFGKIICMVQYDAYHVYTVDIHSIFMVKEIENLINNNYEDEFPFLTKLSESVSRRHILYLACLFHDMGKGEGRNHAQKGAALIPRISKRMGLTREEGEILEFLVKHHLIMPHFSQRRDIHDFNLIMRFAKSVKTLEILTMMYLLTFADIRSVGPEVWTNWKGMLLKELYLKTAKVLEKVEFRKEEPKERAEKFSKQVVKILKDELSEGKINKILGKMPYSYYAGFSPQKIAYHLQLIQRAKKGVSTDILFYPNEGYDEFTFWGYDKKGIFSELCGVIRASGINILGARIVTTEDGRILDIFYVNRLSKSTNEEKKIWDKVNENLYKVLSGKVKIEVLVQKRKMQKSIYQKSIPKYPTRIEIDNESSNTSTIIDVYTHDRPGLLFDITSTLTGLGLSIEYAKISTKVDQVVDAFYVQKLDGGKVLDPDFLNKIKDDLYIKIES